MAWLAMTRCGIIGCQMARRPTTFTSSSSRRSASADTPGTLLTITPARSSSGLSSSQTPSMVSATALIPRSPSADGSTTMTARSAAARPALVRCPSDGGQSTRMASYPSTRPSRAVRRRVASRPVACSQRASSGRAGTRSTPSPQELGVTARAAAEVPPPASRRSAAGAARPPSRSASASTQVLLACGSRSTTRTRRPAHMAAEASPSVTEVFPTPPFWFNMVTIAPIGPCCHAARACPQGADPRVAPCNR